MRRAALVAAVIAAVLASALLASHLVIASREGGGELRNELPGFLCKPSNYHLRGSVPGFFDALGRPARIPSGTGEETWRDDRGGRDVWHRFVLEQPDYGASAAGPSPWPWNATLLSSGTWRAPLDDGQGELEGIEFDNKWLKAFYPVGTPKELVEQDVSTFLEELMGLTPEQADAFANRLTFRPHGP